jgi:alanine dehydrogenase
MRIIGAEEIHRIAEYEKVIQAMTDMYRSGCDVIERMMISQPTSLGDVGDCLIQPAWMRGKAFGIKISTVFPRNEELLGRPSIGGLYVLFDGESGEALACIDGTAETLLKTACNSAVASNFLAREDAQVMTMMGAGKLAPYLIRAHSTVRPISKVIIWNRNVERAENLARQFRDAKQGVTVETSAAVAVSQADIVCCATYAEEPILKGDWLKNGAHVDLVGSYRPDQREADDYAIRRAGRIFVDARNSTVEVSGDVIEPIKRNILDAENITDLFELAQGKKAGRTNEQEITVFKSGGGGHEDLATALMIYNQSQREHVA